MAIRCGTTTMGFFYDVLRLPDGQAFRMKMRSMVALLPLTAVAIFEDDSDHDVERVAVTLGQGQRREASEVEAVAAAVTK